MTELKAAAAGAQEPDLSEMLAAERVARMAAEKEVTRLRILARVSEQLASTLDPEQALDLLSRRLVPRLGIWCATYLLDDSGSLATVLAHHRDAEALSVAADLAVFNACAAAALSPESATMRILRGEAPNALILHMDRDSTAAPLQDRAELMDVVHRLGLGSAIVAPLIARGRLLGAFHLTAGPDRADYTEDDLRLTVELAHRAALALDNARLYARERSVAETLQRSLLPMVGDIEGISASAEYLPATAGARVGGDWFDLIQLPDGATGLAIGDVMGHDIGAAASMGQLRSVLRSYAWEGTDPVRVLDRLDQLVQGLEMAQLATCIYARLEAAEPGAPRLLRWANAGHPPPILRTPNGQVRLLDEGYGILIGVHQDPSIWSSRVAASVWVPRGSLILLYTDGLVERRDQDLDRGLDDLLREVSSGGPNEPADALCARLALPRRDDARADDVALLAVSVLGTS